VNGRSRVQGLILRFFLSAFHWCLRRWEVLFFLVVYILLGLQVYFFYFDIRLLSGLHGAIAAFASFDSFIATRLTYVTLPAIYLPLVYLLLQAERPAWARRYFDALGLYVVFRMAIQLAGLNILVFDSVSSRFLLITQLLFFLPYSLLVWGWIYWRLDASARGGQRTLFRLDCEGEVPRPIDYFVASFSSVFSPSINAIKGNSARARILILGHGFLIYDVMGLTLSRAVALVQSR
jgi:hypothetical protein